MHGNSGVCFIGLGANLGDPVANLRAAVDAIAGIRDCVNLRCSSIYKSAPQETTKAQPDYFNAVVSFATNRDTEALWRELQSLELRLGRTRGVEKNIAREIDIDFLLHGETTSDTRALTLPHPRLTQRAFVLLPLLELAPALVIPGKGYARDFLDSVKNQRIERVEHLGGSLCS